MKYYLRKIINATEVSREITYINVLTLDDYIPINAFRSFSLLPPTGLVQYNENLYTLCTYWPLDLNSVINQYILFTDKGLTREDIWTILSETNDIRVINILTRYI